MIRFFKKNIGFALSLIFISVYSFAQADTSGAKFSFLTKRYHDFGGIYQNAYVTYQFEFKNSGKQPLLIKEIHSSSKAMNTPPYKIVISWTKTAIFPGLSGMIEISVKAQSDTGTFKHAIYVSSNAAPGAYPLLYIGGKIVYDQPGQSVPELVIPSEYLEQEIIH